MKKRSREDTRNKDSSSRHYKWRKNSSWHACIRAKNERTYCPTAWVLRLQSAHSSGKDLFCWLALKWRILLLTQQFHIYNKLAEALLIKIKLNCQLSNSIVDFATSVAASCPSVTENYRIYIQDREKRHDTLQILFIPGCYTPETNDIKSQRKMIYSDWTWNNL